MMGVPSTPAPYTAGVICQRTESPICGSPLSFSPGCSSRMQIRIGAQTRVASPAPKAYMTRPSGPGDGKFDSARNSDETRTASAAVGESTTSDFGLYRAGAGETGTDE